MRGRCGRHLGLGMRNDGRLDRHHRQHLRRQVFGFDQLRGRHDGQPVANIFELTHVARKREGRKLRQRGIRDALGFGSELLGALLQEVPSERGHVFTALAQSRQTQTNHVEPVKQVFAKATDLDALFQVLMGCGDDPHIRLDRVVATDPIKVTVAQHAQ